MPWPGRLGREPEEGRAGYDLVELAEIVEDHVGLRLRTECGAGFPVTEIPLQAVAEPPIRNLCEPFLRAGIDAVDIIQLTSYPHWHRADDTIDKVSAQSMKIVGETILASLPRIAEYIIKNNPQKVPNTKTIQ